MKLLYLSCHEILEYDELRMWSDLGIECYSLGAYTYPGATLKRPPLELPVDEHFIELATRYGKELHPEMIADKDVIVIMHTPEFVHRNWEVLRSHVKAGGRVVWRSIGQSTPTVEDYVETWQINDIVSDVVRYSPRESRIVNYAGGEACMRFAKRPSEFHAWEGPLPHVITFAQSHQQRADHNCYAWWDLSTHGISRTVYGPGNENHPFNGGVLAYEDQLWALSESAAGICGGTYPASYTLTFVEMIMAGLPFVVPGPEQGNGPQYSGNWGVYECAEILSGSPFCLVYDDPRSARSALSLMVSSRALGRDISTYLTTQVAPLFDEAAIAMQWKEFFNV